MKEISRQRKWQLKMESQGRCGICGKKLVTKNYCQKHRIRHSKRVLAKYHKNKLAPPKHNMKWVKGKWNKVEGDLVKRNKMIDFQYKHLNTQEEVRKHIKECEGRHTQQAIYSTYHDALTQVCFGCRTVRSNIKIIKHNNPLTRVGN